MLSLSRRQLLIGGLASFAVPAVSFAGAEKLVLSGRITNSDGKPIAGASFTIGSDQVTTDADGRFMLVTDTRACAARNARRDAGGTWRATVGFAV
jgi:hypothetical protein